MTGLMPIINASLLVSAGLSLWIAWAAWRRGLGFGRESLSLLMLMIGEWSLAAYFLNNASSTAEKILWTKISYIGISCTPLLFFILALEFYSQKRWITRWFIWLLWLLPAVNILLAFSNEWHHWMWASTTQQPDSPLLLVQGGPWFPVFMIYSYMMLVGGVLSLVWAVITFRNSLRFQAILALLGSAFPILANTAYLVKAGPFTNVNLTPQAFSITGVILIWSIVSLKFMNPLPVARGKLLETMAEAVIIIDSQKRISYLNPVACQMLETNLVQATGMPASEVLKIWPYLVKRFSGPTDTPTEALEIQSTQNRWFDLRITPLTNERRNLTGWLVLLNNITQNKEIKHTLETLINDLQTITQVSTSLATSMDFQEMLQQIVDLTQARLKVYHAQVYLLDESNQNLVLKASSGDTGRQMVAQGRSIALEQEPSLVARCGRNQESFMVNNVAEDPGFLPHDLLPETSSELVVPLMISQHLMGVLDVQDRRPDRFTEQDLEVVTALAAQIVVALQNARNFELLQLLLENRNKELELMYVLAAKASENRSIPELLQWIVGRLPVAMRFPEDCQVAIDYEGMKYGTANPDLSPNQIMEPIQVTGKEIGKMVVAYPEGRHFAPEERNLLVSTVQRLQSIIIDDAIHQQKADLQEALQLARMGHFEYDFSLGKVLISDELFEILGTSKAEQGGNLITLENIGFFLQPGSLESIISEVKAWLQEGEERVVEREVRFTYHNDQGDCERNALFRARAERDRQGNLIKVMGTVQDITERVKTEEQIRRLAVVIEQAKETVVITDTQGKIVYANPHFESITGYSASEALGKNPNILKSGLQNLAFYKNLWRTILNGNTWNGIFINRRKDGSLYHEAATIFPITSTEGEIINFAAVKRDITDQVKAEESLREATRQQTMLTEITLAALEQSELPNLLQVLADRMRELLKADGCFLMLWDENKQNSISAAASGVLNEVMDGLVRLEPGEITITAAVLAAEKTLVVNDVFATPYISLMGAAKFPARSLMGLPLIASEKKLGAEIIAHKQLHTFTTEEIAMYERSAAQISLALLKAWLVEAEQHQRQLAETLQATGQVLSGTLNIDQLLDRIMDQIQQIVPFDSGTLFLVEGDTARAIRSRGYERFGESFARQVTHTAFEIKHTTTFNRILKTHQPLIITDASEYPGWIPIPITIQAWIGAPILAQDQVIGFLSLEKNQTGFYDADHVMRLTAYLGQASLALQNAQLFETAQRNATEAETLRLAAAAITSTLKLEEIIDLILEQLNLVVPYDSSSVLFYQEGVLEIVGERGFSDPSKVIGIKFPVDGDNPSARVYHSRKPVILDNAPRRYPVFLEPPHNRIQSWLGIPLILQGRVTGMISLDSEKLNTFNNNHARLAAAYAGQVAIALENARLFEQVQKLAVTDPLTGLYNRRFFFAQAKSEFERSKRYQQPLSIIILDIDDFKKINDAYGHPVGDQVLQTVARLCKENVRELDVVGRYGGEEFVILLPETPLVVQQPDRPGTSPFSESGIPNWGAVAAAERLRLIVANSTLHTEPADLHVTISLGVAEYKSELASPEALLNNADQALLKAKRDGKNRVVCD